MLKPQISDTRNRLVFSTTRFVLRQHLADDDLRCLKALFQRCSLWCAFAVTVTTTDAVFTMRAAC